MGTEKLRKQLESGALDMRLREIYLSEDPAEQRARTRKVLDMYDARFGQDNGPVCGQVELFSAPGRTELGGNHTDHQRGCVLAASISLDLMAAAAPNGTSTVVLESEGYDVLRIDISDETVHPEEVNQTASLIRGISAAIRQRGYQPQGFNACVISDVPGGSGLSSSAAFESLIGVIFNHMFCRDALDAVEIAKIGQYAENVYYGKPCGLMDQMACSVGGVIAIDFEQQENPQITRAPFSFADSGYQLCIIDSGADHMDLTEDYAAVPAEMKSIANYFGKEVLREVSEEQFYDQIVSLRNACGDRAVLRASHFYRENERVKAETAALLAGDFQTYLHVVRESGHSSFMYLQNVFSSRLPGKQAVAVALMIAEHILGGEGACRVHGGGFAGTIQAFVPKDQVEEFRQEMERVLGEGSCNVLQIRPYGGIVIA
ncbi:MAG: galactokinase [Lachnospiraceae bacterium]|nr:galactokinase [Lachnospiraceae bacterium]